MHGRRERLHVLIQAEKTCICLSNRYNFLPLFTDNTFTNWFQLDSSTAKYFRGKIFKGGELETTVQVIPLLKLFTSKKLQDNPVSSDTLV